MKYHKRYCTVCHNQPACAGFSVVSHVHRVVEGKEAKGSIQKSNGQGESALCPSSSKGMSAQEALGSSHETVVRVAYSFHSRARAVFVQFVDECGGGCAEERDHSCGVLS